jgi:hypothetical protein
MNKKTKGPDTFKLNKCYQCIHYRNGYDLLSFLKDKLEIKSFTISSWVRCAKLNVIKANTNACFQFWPYKEEDDQHVGVIKYKRRKNVEYDRAI